MARVGHLDDFMCSNEYKCHVFIALACCAVSCFVPLSSPLLLRSTSPDEDDSFDSDDTSDDDEEDDTCDDSDNSEES